MKFNKEEVNLCKQVAEKHRKEIKYGDWVGVWAWAQNHTLHYIAQTHVVMPDNQITKKLHCLNGIRIFEKDVIPLWTISDCLEFLGEKGFTIIQACEHPMSNEWIVEVNPYFSNAVKIMGHKSFDVRGDTLLEACLKAVLAVLEEKS